VSDHWQREVTKALEEPHDAIEQLAQDRATTEAVLCAKGTV
jgi:hypothetical protein